MATTKAEGGAFPALDIKVGTGISPQNTPPPLPTSVGQPMAVYEPSDEHRREAMAMATVGLSRQDIAIALGISTKVLAYFYGRDINSAIVRARAAVASKMFKDATEGKRSQPRQWWLERKGGKGWRDPGKQAGPVAVLNLQINMTLPEDDEHG